MVRQPAYLRNLKEYARRRLTDSKSEIAELIADYSTESDRGAIILVATTIEDMLQDQITKKLPALSTDETARKKMFEQDGLISSFSKKIEMAYAMGIIDEDYRKKIDLVREIRNACAHSRFPISMEKKVLLDVCKALIPDMLDDIRDHKPKTLRDAFMVKCTFIAHYVITGEKVEGANAQLKFWAALKAPETKPDT